jgi:hypothetical protein
MRGGDIRIVLQIRACRDTSRNWRKLADISLTRHNSFATRSVHHRSVMREWFWIGVVLTVAIVWDIHSFDGRATSMLITIASNAIHQP